MKMKEIKFRTVSKKIRLFCKSFLMRCIQYLEIYVAFLFSLSLIVSQSGEIHGVPRPETSIIDISKKKSIISICPSNPLHGTFRIDSNIHTVRM